ncbi:homocysteine S-methyltransferase family protein [Desulfovibrio inopinatus]|uniref:homocysteine S-methyltransferase family protein n=1 Tax=Desulfovibrio inopinatus TaxID=102109 RepID=UPI00040BBE2C|nr:homocysteine S-methyltransferase family protein [Desulfovibrio inopinatus]
MNTFRSLLQSDTILVFDGAMGTLLQKRGLPPGSSPEAFGLARPDIIEDIHRQYIDAGSMVVTANTFGGTRFKLPADIDPTALNRAMAETAKKAVAGRALVAGSIGPTGHFVKPLGDVTMRELVAAFKEQITGLVQGGADLLVAETHFDLAELKAVILAAREVCDLPIVTCMTFEEGASLTGTPPRTYLDTMQNLGVDMIGINCGMGPQGMMPLVREWLEAIEIPFFVKPNAGIPKLVDGQTVFDLGPEEFAEQTEAFVDLGAKALSGCCGTSPEHIGALAKRLAKRNWTPPTADTPVWLSATSRFASAHLGFGCKSVLIGERINPTGKKVLTEELQQGRFTEALRLAKEQVELGAGILDVNAGAAMADEVSLLPGLSLELMSRFHTPLCFDSNNKDAIIEALWTYPASALVNSISGEPGRMETLGPVCKQHGAPFVLLPLIGRKLPESTKERLDIIEKLLVQAEALGIPKRLILVDALALTVSSKPDAAVSCLETIRHCREVWKLPTVLGLSNISFGLPARELINAEFLTMCMAAGLSACIANPSSETLRRSAAVSEVLLGRDRQAESFIANYADWTPTSGSGASGTGSAKGTASSAKKADTIKQAVIKGDKDAIVPLVQAALENGVSAKSLLNEELIPGIMDVGEKYERKEYFLPQLLLSAEVMRSGFHIVKPLLGEDGDVEKKATVIMATVEGDIHDIGKNIVCLMLGNHGFDVIDLGKDVSAESIVDAAQQHGARLIGLSALMTTTMVRMKDTIDLLRQRGLDTKVMIGGAVITAAFCEAIEADGFATDAVSAVKTAERLTQLQ